jgi:hypothetical protein
MIVCGSLMLAAVSFGGLGLMLESSKLKITGMVLFCVATGISCLPLIFGLCYLTFEKIMRRKADGHKNVRSNNS